MYSFTSNIRFSEVDVNRRLSLASIVNYFQDCSTFQSEALGVGFDYLEREHRVWLMSAWQIVIYRLPGFGETVHIGTWPYDFKSMYGYRNFVMQSPDGDTWIAANSIWVYADTVTGRPVKVPEQLYEIYRSEAPYPMQYAGRKLPLPGQTEDFAPVPVTHAMLDSNHHVNNGQYIRLAESYLPDGFTTGELRADYRKAAVLGNMLYPKRACDETSCTLVLADADGKPYTTVQFLKRME